MWRAGLGPRQVVCYVRGVQVTIGVTSELERFRAATYATKEPETLDWLDVNLQESDVFLDIGANIGLYALYAAKKRPDCQVYAFEPAFQNFSSLCRNIALNSLTNVVPSNLPVSDREAFDFFYVSDVEPGSALHSFGEPSSFQLHSPSVSLRQGAFSISLDALVRKYGLPQPALIKIDVDGIEDRILRGAQTVLRSERLRSFLVEWNSGASQDVADLERRLRDLGYRLSGRSEWTAEAHGLKSQNLIFSRR